MRRRVGVARAVVTDPPLVLFDSPTAGLDPITANTIIKLIVKQRDVKHTTTLLVTHRYQNGNLLANFHYEPRTDALEPNLNGFHPAGQTKFLLGWLLPHGVIEIPAILIAGQAGLVLALALIGWGKRIPLRIRLREASQDLITLIFGVGVLLVWAGFVEAFLSQYHEPIIPYSMKIAFGLVELLLLFLFLAKSGSGPSTAGDEAEVPASGPRS